MGEPRFLAQSFPATSDELGAPRALTCRVVGEHEIGWLNGPSGGSGSTPGGIEFVGERAHGLLGERHESESVGFRGLDEHAFLLRSRDGSFDSNGPCSEVEIAPREAAHLAGGGRQRTAAVDPSEGPE